MKKGTPMFNIDKIKDILILKNFIYLVTRIDDSQT